MSLDNVSYEEVAALFDYPTLEDFFAAIGYGDLNSQRVVAKVLQVLRHEEVFQETEKTTEATTPEGIRVKGVGSLLTQLAQCCKPDPDDPEPIVGFITRGRGVTIHRWGCPNILRRTNTGEAERLIEVDWGTGEGRVYPVVIKIRAWDREGLLRDIANIVSEEGVNMRAVNSAAVQKTNLATMTATLEITAISQLISILAKIEHLPNVIEVTRQAR